MNQEKISEENVRNINKVFSSQFSKCKDILEENEQDCSSKKILELINKGKGPIISIPHSGQLVPLEFMSNLDINKDLKIEIDAHSDLPYLDCQGEVIISRLAPFIVDLNRNIQGSENNSVPHHLKNDPFHYFNINDESVLLKDWDEEQIKILRDFYNTYHNCLKDLIEKMKTELGFALLIDCHSMTSKGLGRVHDKGKSRANFVVGTLDNKSAHPKITKAFVETLSRGAADNGWSVATDDPYSGGFIIRNHSDPANNVHALQIEISMNTYMQEGFIENENERYMIKEENLKIVQDLIKNAVEKAFEAGSHKK